MEWVLPKLTSETRGDGDIELEDEENRAVLGTLHGDDADPQCWPVSKHADNIITACNAFEPMRKALAGALEWYGRPDENATERFERHAEQFYRIHGMLAPGKSEPMEMYGGPEREERRLRLWREWCAKRTAEVDGAMAAALRAADGEGAK